MPALFTPADFAVFKSDSLEDRMSLIRKQIQPTFQVVGDDLCPYLEEKTGRTFAFHIAQHRRRTKNPPDSTWCAFGGNKRGYKNFPHFEIGINRHYIFIWLALIDNPKHKVEMGRHLLSHSDILSSLDTDYIISKDHTQDAVHPLDEQTLTKTLERMITVKKGECLIGKIITPTSALLLSDEKQLHFFKTVYDDLLPAYQQLLDLYEKLEK